MQIIKIDRSTIRRNPNAGRTSILVPGRGCEGTRQVQRVRSICPEPAYLFEYIPTDVKCSSCDAVFDYDLLESDAVGSEDGETYSDTICPKCGAWYCCETEFEQFDEKEMVDVDYSAMTDEEFDAILEELVEEMSASRILAYGDVNALLREELNNEVLELWKERNHEIKLGRIVKPEILRELFIGREDEFWGVQFEDDRSWFQDFPQYSGVQCTGFAAVIKHKVGKRINIYGFSSDENPTAGILCLHDGHDFAVLDGRYIIDPWLVEVEKGIITTPTGNRLNLNGKGIFDIRWENWLVHQIYGDLSKWKTMNI